MSKPKTIRPNPMTKHNPSDLTHYGLVTELTAGDVDPPGMGLGRGFRFMPELNAGMVGLVLPPHMVVALKKTLEDAIDEHGWTENSAPPAVMEALKRVIASKPN